MRFIILSQLLCLWRQCWLQQLNAEADFNELESNQTKDGKPPFKNSFFKGLYSLFSIFVIHNKLEKTSLCPPAFDSCVFKVCMFEGE